MTFPVYPETPKEEAVAIYAAKGMKVMLTDPRSKAPLGSVHPHGLKDATDDIEFLINALRNNPHANLGIATGERSGVWVVDIDGEEGFASIDALEAKHGLLPATQIVQTARGMHLYLAWPKGADIRSKAGVIAPGVDQRGNGGYVIVPPSTHPSGVQYQWRYTILDDLEIEPSRPADAPPWLILAAMERSRIVPADSSRDMHTRGREQRNKEQSGEGPIGEGQRNDELARKAGAMRRVGFTESEILAALLKLNADRCTPPLDRAEVEKIAASIAKYPAAPAANVTNAAKFFRPMQIVKGRVA